jgi:hypothetical protein
VRGAIDDLWPKIEKLEEEMLEWATTHRPHLGVLIAQINLFRDWVDLRREAMVDAVIANLRALVATEPRRGGRP